LTSFWVGSDLEAVESASNNDPNKATRETVELVRAFLAISNPSFVRVCCRW
jgi:hypothetical protein